MKLVQKTLLNGTREFEIEGDVVNVRIKKLFKEEKLTVGLSTLNPEPVVNTPYLEFYGRVKSAPLLSLFLNKPDTEQFNAFVDTLKQRVLQKGHVTGDETASRPRAQASGLDANVYDEPPEFGEFGHNRKKNKGQNVNVARIGETIELLERYLVSDDIKPLLSALEALKLEPQNESYFAQMERAFNDLGIMQGAVLTYAPYLSVLLADDPFADN